MLDTLTLVIILALVFLYTTSVWRRRRSSRSGWDEGTAAVKRGPVPGYSYLPGRYIRWDPANRPPGLAESWTAFSMETIHAGQRTRLVLTLRSDEMPPTDQFTIMKTLAQRLYQRTGCKVVAVQMTGASSPGHSEAVLIFAPDGGGWTGTTTGATLTVSLKGREAFRMNP